LQSGHKCCARNQVSQFDSVWVAARHIQREPQDGHLTVAKGMMIHTKATTPPSAMQVSVSLGVKVPANDGIATNSTESGEPIIMTRIFHP
jgi:hypothetical protein